MAYYDPYENDSYYNPMNNTNTSQGGDGIASGLVSMATGMVKMLAVHTIAKGVGRMAGSAISRGAANWAGKALQNNTRPFGLSADKLSKISQAKSFGDTVRASSKRINNMARRMDIRNRRSQTILDRREKYLAGVKSRSVLEHTQERFKSVFRDSQTFKAVAGRVIARDVVAGSLIGYAYDAASGHLADYGVRDDIGALNIPGHALNYAKYMAKNAGTFAIMGNLPKIGAGALGRVGLGAKRALAANSGFTDKVFEFAAKLRPANVNSTVRASQRGAAVKSSVKEFEDSVNNSILRRRTGQMTDAIGATVKTLNTSVRAGFYNSFNKMLSNEGPGAAAGTKFQDQVNKVTNQIRTEFAARQQARAAKARTNMPGIDKLNVLSRFANEGRNASAPAGLSEAQQMNDLLNFINSDKRKKKQSVVGEILGATPSKVGDVINHDFIDSISDKLSRRFATGDAKPISDAIKNLHVGEYHFKRGKFNADLSYFSPTFMAKRALGAVANINLNFMVPLPMMNKNMSIGAITGLDSVVADEFGATIYDTNLHGDGAIFRTAGGRKTINDLLAESNNTRGHSNDIAVAMSGRRLYSIDGHKIKELDTYDAIIKNTTPATNKGFSEIQKTEVNAYLYEGMHNPDPARADVFRRLKVAMDGYNTPKNGIGRLLHKIGFDHRNIISNKFREIQDVLGADIGPNGKLRTTTHKLFSAYANMLTGKNTSMERLDDMIPVMKSVLKSSEQEVAMILRKPGAHSELAKMSMKHIPGNTDFMYSAQSMADLLDQTMTLGVGDKNSLWARLTNDSEAKAVFNVVMGNTSKSQVHKHRARMGHLSDMTTHESAVVKFIEGAAAHAVGEDGIHPFVSSAVAMQKQGIISHSEAAAMKIYGITKMMFDEVSLNGVESLTGTAEKNALQKVYKRHEQAKLIGLKDLTTFLSNPDLRPNHFAHTETMAMRKFGVNPNDILDGFTGVKDHTSQMVLSLLPGENEAMAGFRKVLDVGTQRLVNLVSDTTGLQFDPFKYGNGALGAGKFIGTKLLQVSAAATAYKVIDAAVATAPFLDETSLDEGVTGMLADTTAKAHLMTSRMLNATGIAGAGRYLSGLMPGFNSAALGGLYGAAINVANGPSKMIAGAMRSAIGARMLSAYMPDFTKTYEQLESEYSGETDIPIIKGRGWLLGTTPWQGNKVVGYKPNWYVEAKSRWKASETLYGSEFRKLLHEPLPGIGVTIGDFVDPYYMERKHFFTRPYHVTGGFQENMPLGFGTLADNTIGHLLKPKKIMHSEFLHGENEAEQTSVSAHPIPNPREQLQYLHRTGTNNPRMGHNRPGYMGAYVYNTSKHHGQNIADTYLSEMESAMGLVGFASDTARTALADKAKVIPTLETAGRITSSSRAYRDANLGGMGIYSEVIRRFIKKDDPKKYGINNIPNMLPNWLPERFMTGDPYAKIIKGEIRLPGKAYELTHDVNFTLPGRASMLGAEESEIVRYFTGFKTPLLEEELDVLETGTQFHENIQNWLKAEGILISAENFVYDAKNNISGHIDGVIRDGLGGRGRRALEIKSISDEGLKKLEGPKNQHVGQLNFYLHEMQMQKGTILYVSRDNPADYKVFEIDYNPDRYSADIRKIHKARAAASQMIAKGKQGMAKGFSYSWVDRLKILADVAPASKQFKEAKSVVQQQMSAGMLDERDIAKFRNALKVRENTLRQYELYPMRFKGKIFSPDAEYNRQSINENIKAAAEYSLPERIVGAAWETFTNTNTFITNKFFAFKDPLEHYKQYQVQGKEFTPWTDPYGSFIQPRIRNIIGSTSMMQGGISAGIDFGYTFGGFGMGLVGGAIGAAYGGLNSADSAYIPGSVETERKINDYFDTLKYYKNARMEQLAEGMEADRFRNAKNETFFSMLGQDGGHRYANIFKAAYSSERPYIHAWLNERDPDKQREILNMVPERLAHTLQGHWKNQGSKIATRAFIDNSSAEIANGMKSAPYTMQMLDPSVMDEDIKLKVIRNEGLNAHDFGLGWGEQMIRAQNDLGSLPTVDIDEMVRSTHQVDPGTIRGAIFNLLQQHGLSGRVNIYVNNHVNDGSNKVTLTLQHDRLQEIRNAVDFRERYM